VNADDDVQPTTPLRSGEPWLVPWLVPAPWTSAIPLIRDLLAFPGPATPQSVAVYYLALFIGRRGLLAGSRKSNNTTISPNGRSRNAASRYMYMIYGPPATAAAVVGLSRASVTDLLHQASPFVLWGSGLHRDSRHRERHRERHPRHYDAVVRPTTLPRAASFSPDAHAPSIAGGQKPLTTCCRVQVADVCFEMRARCALSNNGAQRPSGSRPSVGLGFKMMTAE
jgi:hypothetical protein